MDLDLDLDFDLDFDFDLLLINAFDLDFFDLLGADLSAVALL